VIFITAKFLVLPEFADRWPEIIGEFTSSTRAEKGCLWFEWSRNVRTPNEYILIEAFLDDSAANVHVQSDHFTVATETLPRFLVETPKIINFTIDQEDWSELGELRVPDRVPITSEASSSPTV